MWLPCFVLAVLASLFKSRIRLEAENAALRHQLIVLRPGHVRLTNVGSSSSCIAGFINPDGSHDYPSRDPRTLASGGLRCSWRWKSRRRGGRPQIEADLRTLIRRMSVENPLWGSPRISRRIAQARLCRRSIKRRQNMVKRRGPPSRGGAPHCTTMPQILLRRTCLLSDHRL
jgi:hypothetical protein